MPPPMQAIWGNIWKCTVEKSNKCNQCDYASSRAGNLRSHLKSIVWKSKTNATTVIIQPAILGGTRVQINWRATSLYSGPRSRPNFYVSEFLEYADNLKQNGRKIWWHHKFPGFFAVQRQLNRRSCHSVRHFLRHLLILTFKSNPRYLWPMRHLISRACCRVVRFPNWLGRQRHGRFSTNFVLKVGTFGSGHVFSSLW